MPTPRANRCFAAFMRSERWLGNAVIAILLLQILALAQHTFAWRYGEDVGFFYYFSWLVNERGYLPYRDLHETVFPVLSCCTACLPDSAVTRYSPTTSLTCCCS